MTREDDVDVDVDVDVDFAHMTSVTTHHMQHRARTRPHVTCETRGAGEGREEVRCM